MLVFSIRNYVHLQHPDIIAKVPIRQECRSTKRVLRGSVFGTGQGTYETLKE